MGRPCTLVPADPDSVASTEGLRILIDQCGNLVAIEVLLAAESFPPCRKVKSGHIGELGGSIPGRSGAEHIRIP